MGNRKCYTCGKEYQYCYSCPDENRPVYMAMFCCEHCLNIFDVLCDYDSKKLSAQAAYKLIKDFLPNDISTYSEGCQKLIKQMHHELNTTKQEAHSNTFKALKDKNKKEIIVSKKEV